MDESHDFPEDNLEAGLFARVRRLEAAIRQSDAMRAKQAHVIERLAALREAEPILDEYIRQCQLLGLTKAAVHPLHQDMTADEMEAAVLAMAPLALHEISDRMNMQMAVPFAPLVAPTTQARLSAVQQRQAQQHAEMVRLAHMTTALLAKRYTGSASQ